MKKYYFALFISLLIASSCFSQIKLPFAKWWEPEGLAVFKEAYPHIKFVCSYDKEVGDWLVHIFVPQENKKEPKEFSLYWCESKFLPKEELKNKDEYTKLLYRYPKQIPNPENFSKEFVAKIKENTTTENRKNGPGTPPFFFDALYDCKTRASTESHIVKVPFIDRTINVHERIKEPLQRVSKRINDLPKDTPELKKFFSTLTRTDGFAWRNVRDSKSRSFHGIGLAVDVLPKGYYQKIIYWRWQKQLDPEGWMLTPISKRWCPPQEIIDIFEDEGFIWGGKWMIWDNMHFEYHPELILYNKIK